MRYELVVMGASWGGLDAIGRILDALPEDFGCAIALVQHRGPNPSALAELLARHTTRPVCEVDDKEGLSPGKVFVGPPGYHLLVERGHFALSTEDPVRFSRPSIDLLFESAADAYREQLIGVVLTGANDDGARGLARIKARGGYTIVQEPASAMRDDMPLAALALTEPDAILPIEAVGRRLVQLVASGIQHDRESGSASPTNSSERTR